MQIHSKIGTYNLRIIKNIEVRLDPIEQHFLIKLNIKDFSKYR